MQAPDGVTLENLANPNLMNESVQRNYEHFMNYHGTLKNQVSELVSYLMIRY